MATMAGSQPRQRAFSPVTQLPPLTPRPMAMGKQKQKKQREAAGGKKTRTLHTNQKNGHLAEFMHERVRTVRRLVQGIVCQSSHSGQQAGAEAGAEWRTGTACQQGQATASAAYGRQVAYGGFSTQNQTETEPNQTEAMRNETKCNQNEHVFQLKTLRRAPKIHLNCPQWTDTLAHALKNAHTHTHTLTERQGACKDKS